MVIEACQQEFDVDELHADVLSALSKYAIRDTKKAYSAGIVYVPFERIIEILDLTDKNFQFKTS